MPNVSNSLAILRQKVFIPDPEGLTPSETRLALKCRKTFLAPWTYPNLYFKKGKVSNEFCDTAVICNNIAIIFSDKAIAYSTTLTEPAAWTRWAKAALFKSINQLHGAKRIIEKGQELFLDSALTLPLDPELYNRVSKIYLVAVVSGNEAAASDYFNDKYSSILLDNQIVEESCHTTPPYIWFNTRYQRLRPCIGLLFVR